MVYISPLPAASTLPFRMQDAASLLEWLWYCQLPFRAVFQQPTPYIRKHENVGDTELERKQGISLARKRFGYVSFIKSVLFRAQRQNRSLSSRPPPPNEVLNILKISIYMSLSFEYVKKT